MKDKKDKLQQELDWFRDFGRFVNLLSRSVHNKACELADEIQEELELGFLSKENINRIEESITERLSGIEKEQEIKRRALEKAKQEEAAFVEASLEQVNKLKALQDNLSDMKKVTEEVEVYG